ncbi:MAG: DNA recombination protein RmuC [Candidatus Eremiobacteraeota bacterium]|nr:DNA recombination protein RmuC [Candidatus Eremiobacteraeota bacterium]NNM91961.1 DNA recombination protein RmuC [Candidatus Eremiobacteraeota bacterium]
MAASLFILIIVVAVAVTALVTSALLRHRDRDAQDPAARFELMLERAKNELTATQREIVESSRTEFLALAGQRLDTTQAGIAAKLSELVAPVGEKLTQVDAYVRELEQKRLTAYVELRKEVEQLTKSGGELSLAAATLSERTTKLASALRNPQTRGRWGELQLRRVCELAGMLEHCDFEEQKRFAGIDKAQQPDLIVKLPNDRFICVDAKVPLDAYLDAIDSTDETAKAAHFKRYGDALKSRITALAAAKYQTIPGSVDFVVMFIPGENFLSAAYSQDEDIIEFAAKKAVYVVGPLTFMALLRSYGMVWQSLKQEQNVREIAAQGRVVFDRVRILSDHLNDLGKNLNASVSAFNKAIGSYESRLLPGSRELAKLAANPEAVSQGDIGRIETNAGSITALSAQEAALALQREEERDRIALQDGSLG